MIPTFERERERKEEAFLNLSMACDGNVLQVVHVNGAYRQEQLHSIAFSVLFVI